MTMPFAYFENQIVPRGEARVSIASNSLQYGTTCFAGIRGYVKGAELRIFRLSDHYERLMDATKILGMDFHIPKSKFMEVMEALVDANKPPTDFYIRPFVYSSDEQISPKKKGLNFQLAIYFVPLGNYFDPSTGMRLLISSWRKFSDASMSTKAKAGGCYVNSFLATNEAHNAGYDEALMMDDKGNIAEASVANILLVRRGKIFTPSTGSSLLEGITLRSAITLLHDEGMNVEFQPIDRSMIYTADEMILTGTAAQYVFASSVDGRSLRYCDGPGNICTLLRKRMQDVIAMNHARSSEWITTYPGAHHGN